MNRSLLPTFVLSCTTLLLAVSCGSQADGPLTFRGTVTHLTAGQLQLTTLIGDTLTFGTADLDSTTRADLLPADMVEVLATATISPDGDTSYQAKTVLVQARSLIRAIQGSWSEPIPGVVEGRQGIELRADGTAASIGMSTLQLRRWRMPQPHTVVLEGESIGNSQTIAFSDTLTLTRLTADSLVLSESDGRVVWRLARVR